MLTKIYLDGTLGELFGYEWDLDLAIPSAREACHALSNVCKGFADYVRKHSCPGYHVFIGEKDIGENDLDNPTGKQEIRIMPALAGAKSGWFQVILGVVMIVAGIILYATPWGVPLIMSGASMVIGGVAQLLFAAPTDKTETDKPDDRASYTFGGPVNTSGQGNCISLLYGEAEVGSQVISAGIVTDGPSYNLGTNGGAGGGQHGVNHPSMDPN